MSLADIFSLLRIFWPVLLTPVIYMLRKSNWGGWLAVAVSFGAAYTVQGIPVDTPAYLLGRPLVFTDLWVSFVGLFYIATGLLFLTSLINSQGWSFYPIGLLIVPLMAAATASRHLGIAALLVAVAAILAMFIIQGGRTDSIRAASRFLVLMMLATLPFLLVAWQLDHPEFLLPDSAQRTQVGVLAAIGFALWLGITPLHGWISAISLEAKPGITAFILFIFPTAAIFHLLNLWQATPWLLELPQAQNILLVAGLFSMVVGGIFAAVQRSLVGFMGYAIVFDTGSLLAAFSLNTEAGLVIIFFTILVRGLSLVLLANAITALQTGIPGDSFGLLTGLGSRQPVATVGLVIGGLSLVGAPFTAGFAARWLLLDSLSMWGGQATLFAALGSIGVAIGVMRALMHLLKPEPSAPQLATQATSPSHQLLIALLIILAIGGGLFPQVGLNIIREMAAAIQLGGIL